MRCNGQPHQHTGEDGRTWSCRNLVDPGRSGAGRLYRGREERSAEEGGGLRRHRRQFNQSEGSGFLYEGDYQQGIAAEYGVRLAIGFAMLGRA